MDKYHKEISLEAIDNIIKSVKRIDEALLDLENTKKDSMDLAIAICNLQREAQWLDAIKFDVGIIRQIIEHE